MNINQFKPVNQDSDFVRGQMGTSQNARTSAFQKNGNTWHNMNINQFTPARPQLVNAITDANAAKQNADQANSPMTIAGETFQGTKSTLGGMIRGLGKSVGTTLAAIPDMFTKKPLAMVGGSYQQDAYNNAAAGKPDSNASLEGEAAQSTLDTVGLATGVGDVAEPILSAADSVSNLVDNVAKKVFLGKNATELLNTISNPEARAFVPTENGGGGKTVSDVVDTIKQGLNSFETSSKAALQTVKNKIPDVAVDAEKIESTVNDAIMNRVKSSATYKGIKGTAENLFKSPQDLINSGLMSPDEAGKVRGMLNSIGNWSDNSARGLLNLKEQLSAFYEDGMNNSNAVLKNIQSGLKNLVQDASSGAGVDIKSALSTASDNIEKSENFTRTLLGNTDQQAETKFTQIANALKNPALKGSALDTIADFKKATGIDLTKTLGGYADYLNLLKDNFPSKAGTIASTLSKRLGVSAAAIGGADYVYNEFKKLF